MKIIGHRGARSLALENSLESIRAALAAGVDGVEFDVRLSSDGHFFLSHDPTLARVSNDDIRIKHATKQELSNVRLRNGERLVSLDGALKARCTAEAIIEAKGNHWASALADYFQTHQPSSVTVISFNHQELVQFHSLMPHVPCYPIERTKPFEAIQLAKRHKLAGVDLKFWVLNPFTYGYARYYKLNIIVYTVNSRFVAWYFRIFFPHVAITTDVPQHMQHLRHEHSQRTSKEP